THSPAEFFAVATETFFEQPVKLRDEHAELYEQLRQFYQQDPAAWSAAVQE
ncbi:MAG: zinc-dependent peptidase, partial [Chloroflexota bacterium]